VTSTDSTASPVAGSPLPYASGPPSPEGMSHRREVSAGSHFGALDGYRAIAALMVVITHVAYSTGLVVTGTWGHLLGRFDFGVPLFFLMSGFLLYRPWARAALEGRTPPGHARYALRRAARILPLYWLVVVVNLAFLPEIQPVAAEQWWRHLLALQIYQPQGAIEGLSQTWSLCTEITFYIALPFLGMLALGRRPRSAESAWRRQLMVLGGMVAVAVAWNTTKVTTDVLPFSSGYWLPAYLDWFAFGMGLALLEVRSRQAEPPAIVRMAMAAARDQVTSLVLAASIFAVAVTPIGGSYDFTPTGPWETMAKHWLYLGAAFFFLLPGIMGGERGVASVLSRPVPHRLGLISYGIFLWHLMFLRMLVPALGMSFFDGGALLLTAVLLPITILVATVTYRLVERPAQRWAHRF
jgi:peptidoglycan/LPS O-acetylase OafA/YrhL